MFGHDKRRRSSSSDEDDANEDVFLFPSNNPVKRGIRKLKSMRLLYSKMKLFGWFLVVLMTMFAIAGIVLCFVFILSAVPFFLTDYKCVRNVCVLVQTGKPRGIPCDTVDDCFRQSDACLVAQCSEKGTDYCFAANDGAHCVCKRSFGGRFCDKILDTCDWGSECNPKGSTCVNLPNQDYSCDCYVGWFGKFCNKRGIAGDTCTTDSHCNNGSCVRNGKIPAYCSCPPHFSGPHCERSEDYADCANQPCKTGHCKEKFENYQCICKGFTGGRKCDKIIGLGCSDSCEHGRCSVKNNKPRCICDKGWGGTYCHVRSVAHKRSNVEHYGSCNLNLLRFEKANVSISDLFGKWYFLMTSDNPWIVQDYCPSMTVFPTEQCTNVLQPKGFFCVYYQAIRNDSGMGYEMRTIRIHDKNTTVGLVENGRIIRFFANIGRFFLNPEENQGDFDASFVDYRVVHHGDFLVLFACKKDDLLGILFSLLLLSKTNLHTPSMNSKINDIVRTSLPHLHERIDAFQVHEKCRTDKMEF